MNYNATVERILQTIHYAVLATVNDDGSPHNSPVFCAVDEARNVYWSSTQDAQHSRNITRTGQAFIVIFDSTDDAAEGVYLEVSVEMLSEPVAIGTALELLGARRKQPFLHPEKFIGDGVQRIFKATPSAIWTNDAHQDSDGDFIRDYRVPIS